LGNIGIRIGDDRKLKWWVVSTTRTLTDEVTKLGQPYLFELLFPANYDPIL
jgi:hypothetical protein